MTSTAHTYPTAPDPDVTVRLDVETEAREHGLSVDELPKAEDSARWDLHWHAALTFADDLEFDDGRGLHYTLATSSGLPVDGFITKTVTPEQLRTYGRAIVALAARADARRRDA